MPYKNPEDKRLNNLNYRVRHRRNQSLEDLYKTYCQGAEKRGLSFNLSFHVARGLFGGDCFYCGASAFRERSSRDVWPEFSKKVRWNGIDRVDNGAGYELGNCVSCCSRCNRMKMDMSIGDFFIHISRIYHFCIDNHRNP